MGKELEPSEDWSLKQAHLAGGYQASLGWETWTAFTQRDKQITIAFLPSGWSQDLLCLLKLIVQVWPQVYSPWSATISYFKSLFG